MKVQAEIQSTKHPDPLRIEVTCDGTRWLFVDEKSKSFARGRDRAVGGQAGREALHLVAAELSDPQRLLRAVKSATIRHEGFTTFSGSRCHKIFIESKDGAQRATWYISADGLLPLLIERTGDAKELNHINSRLTLMEVRVNPPLQGESFQPIPPQGFRELAHLSSPVERTAGAAEAKGPRPAPELVSLAPSGAPLIDWFNHNRDKLRVIGLFAPS